MSFKSVWSSLALLAVVSFAASSAQAQNLSFEGPTGILVTPLASVSPSPATGIGRPAIAYHILVGGPVLGVFNTVSITEGFAKRFEAGYSREDHSAGHTTGLSPLWTNGLNIFHGKANLVPENAFKTKWIPAISVGGILRTNDSNVFNGTYGQTKTNGDIYLVGTKVITQISKKVPIILNGGVRGTNSSLWGLGGNSPDFVASGFGAVGFVITGPGKSTIILASEAIQQPRTIKTTNKFGVSSGVFDIPPTVDYAVRVIPSPKHKINLDFGILQAAGRIAPGVDLQARTTEAIGVSYGF